MDIVVSKDGAVWRAAVGDKHWRCAVGRSGVYRLDRKQEGDGASPEGCWPLRRILYRADRIAPPAPQFPCTAIARQDGWCDDPTHPLYNQPVKLPFAASHEELWREDHLYDIIGILGYNDDPVRPGKGSAVFLHVAQADYGPTAGCAALAANDLMALLAEVKPGVRLCFRDGE